MAQWLIDHTPESVLGVIMGLLTYFVKKRDKKIDELESRMNEMPFIYAMKEDVKEIKSDIKDIKNYLMEDH